MHEIKVRAWDKDKNDWHVFGSIPRLVQPGSTLTLVVHPSLVLEQYTGLCDKYKKEIYEGDIVRLSRAMKYSGNRGDVGAIEADPVELGYRVMNIYPRTRLTEPRSAYLEIIGNIHKNPELLEEAAD